MPEYITVEPNWENLLAWHANALVTHSFKYGAREPVASFMQQVIHLHQKNPRAVERIIERLEGGLPLR